jgi:hypothetical protein
MWKQEFNNTFKEYVGETSILNKYRCQTPNEWEDIIVECAAEIIMVASPKEIQFEQIKEKFGGLRFYVNNANASDNIRTQIRDIIRVAEHKVLDLNESSNNEETI